MYRESSEAMRETLGRGIVFRWEWIVARTSDGLVLRRAQNDVANQSRGNLSTRRCSGANSLVAITDYLHAIMLGADAGEMEMASWVDR